MPNPTENMSAVQECAQARERILGEVRKVIVGQQRVVDELLGALFADGHCLLVGVPGLAKTLLISTLAQVLDLKFSRIQFTPDLMPSDITGTEILEEDRTTGRARVQVRPRTGLREPDPGRRDQPHPAQDAGRTAAGDAGEAGHRGGARPSPLDRPFFVLATQNPIELEGTYPLPEAQLDRFMYHISVDYPEREGRGAESSPRRPARRRTAVKAVLSGADILRIQQTIRRVPVSEHVSPTRFGSPVRRGPEIDLAAVREGLGQLGRGPARFAVPDPGREDPGGS